MKKRNRRNRVPSVPASPPHACLPHTSREPGPPRTCNHKKEAKEATAKHCLVPTRSTHLRSIFWLICWTVTKSQRREKGMHGKRMHVKRMQRTNEQITRKPFYLLY
jgi:hypothetical protein